MWVLGFYVNLWRCINTHLSATDVLQTSELPKPLFFWGVFCIALLTLPDDQLNQADLISST